MPMLTPTLTPMTPTTNSTMTLTLMMTTMTPTSPIPTILTPMTLTTATLTRPTWIVTTLTRKTLTRTLTTPTQTTATTLTPTLITPTPTSMTSTGTVRQHQLHYPNSVSGNISVVDRHGASEHVGVQVVLGSSGRSDSCIPVIASGKLVMPVGMSPTALTGILEAPMRLTLFSGADRSCHDCSNFIVPGVEVVVNGGLAPAYLSHSRS